MNKSQRKTMKQNTRKVTHHLGSHHLQELIKVDSSGSVLVNIRDHLLDLLLLRLKTKGAHGNLEFLGVNGTGAIGIEEVKGLTDLLLLLLGEVGLGTTLGTFAGLTERLMFQKKSLKREG